MTLCMKINLQGTQGTDDDFNTVYYNTFDVARRDFLQMLRNAFCSCNLRCAVKPHETKKYILNVLHPSSALSTPSLFDLILIEMV